MQIRLRVGGHLDFAWRDRLAGLRIAHEDDGSSVLAGTLSDQAALHGLILQIFRMGLPLLSLEISREATGCRAPPPGLGITRRRNREATRCTHLHVSSSWAQPEFDLVSNKERRSP